MRNVIAIFIILLLAGCFENPKRDRIVIPEGFHGTIKIYYKVAGAPALSMEDGYRLVVVPPSGVVKTSSDWMPGKLHDEYLMTTSQGRKPFPSDKLGGGGTDENVKVGEKLSWVTIQ